MRTARAAPLCLTGRGTHGLLQLHRRLLQSHPAALRPRVSLAHLLRTGDANRPTARYPLNRPRKRGNFNFIETWAEIAQAVERATAYWNEHKHPFIWGRRRRDRTTRRLGLAAIPAVSRT